MVLVCIGNTTLQPFDLKSGAKMPKFDLQLSRPIAAEDVVVFTLYGSTFCIHADSQNSRISLRNISNSQLGTPDYDIVIDVADPSMRSLKLSTVDNLLIAKCMSSAHITIYDIRHPAKGMVTSLCASSRARHSDGTLAIGWLGWTYSGGVIIDEQKGAAYKLQVEMDVVLDELLKGQEMPAVMQLLVRRMRCRPCVVRVLREAIMARTSLSCLAKVFDVLNGAYRHAIENVPQVRGPRDVSMVSLKHLAESIQNHSILSEKEIVTEVFFPCFCEMENYQGEDCTIDPEHHASPPSRNPYLVNVVVAYLRSLLHLAILPHRVLTCFLFDICIFFRQEHILQQLLHCQVICDNEELMIRLQRVSSWVPWAVQACLDMALRLQKYQVVADMLLENKEYVDMVPFLINQQESYSVRKLLTQVQQDKEAQANDPDLVEHIVHEIRVWRDEALQSESLPAPDLEGCEGWL